MPVINAATIFSSSQKSSNFRLTSPDLLAVCSLTEKMKRVRDFARATGRLAKTGALDAAGVAVVGATQTLSIVPSPDPERSRRV